MVARFNDQDSLQQIPGRWSQIDLDGQDNPGFELASITPRSSNAYNNNNTNNNGEKLTRAKVPQLIVDKDPVRGTWDNQIEFLLSCISMSVGLGNVWRFPFTAYENGGGAFLIPYFVVLIFIGKPLYFLEMSMGQFASLGQVKVWRMAPIFRGVGYGSMIGSACVLSYYCSLMAITLYYFIASFSKVLPWAECNPDWSKKKICNGTHLDFGIANKSMPEYYFGYVFPQKEDISDGIGYPEWRLSLCLLGAWTLLFFSLVKGIRSSGKVAYFTAIFPYIVLITLLIRGVTLSGASEGIKFFLQPNWEMIMKPKVWYAAAGQCFFSLATGFGPIIMFSSYNPFRHNVYRDAWIISIMDTLTSLLAGLTIFAVLGSLAESKGVHVSEVVKGGPGLAFISYPEAIGKFDYVPQLFSVLFFLMLFTLGMGSATSLAGGLITIICDQGPKFKRWIVTGIVCGCGFLIGLIYVTPGGQFILTLVDYFGANFVIYVMGSLEAIGVAWIYGVNNFCRDIEFMLDINLGNYWKFCWGAFIPVGLNAILIYALITAEPLTHEDHEFPYIANVCGWLLAGSAMLTLPITGAYILYTRKSKGLVGKWKESLQPTKKWGPKDITTRQEWELFKVECEQEDKSF